MQLHGNIEYTVLYACIKFFSLAETPNPRVVRVFGKFFKFSRRMNPPSWVTDSYREGIFFADGNSSQPRSVEMALRGSFRTS